MQNGTEMPVGQTPECGHPGPQGGGAGGQGGAGFLLSHQTLPEDAFPRAPLLGSQVSLSHH